MNTITGQIAGIMPGFKFSQEEFLDGDRNQLYSRALEYFILQSGRKELSDEIIYEIKRYVQCRGEDLPLAAVFWIDNDLPITSGSVIGFVRNGIEYHGRVELSPRLLTVTTISPTPGISTGCQLHSCIPANFVKEPGGKEASELGIETARRLLVEAVTLLPQNSEELKQPISENKIHHPEV